MIKIAVSKIILSSIICLSLNANSTFGKIVGVSDGDTLTLLDSSKTQHKIRLAQIDAPEKSQDFGSVSKKNLSDICFGKSAVANIETIDKYGRLVAVVFCDGIEANLEQTKSGNAWVYTQYAKDKKYFEAQISAKESKLGLWIQDNPTPPWEYRKNTKLYAKNDKKVNKKEIGNNKECGSKNKCSQMSSCLEAKFYLEQCNIRSLDKDGDGVPCEKLCR
jgi:endonuclease YncB( thermonuclease family)